MDNFDDMPPIDPFSPPEDGPAGPAPRATEEVEPGLGVRVPPKNIEVEQGLSRGIEFMGMENMP